MPDETNVRAWRNLTVASWAACRLIATVPFRTFPNFWTATRRKLSPARGRPVDQSIHSSTLRVCDRMKSPLERGRCGGSGRSWRPPCPPKPKSKNAQLRTPWNKGRLVGQKRPLRPKEVWAIRVRLQMKRRKRDLALFNLAIDSKLRGCDLASLRVDDIAAGGRVRDRATIIQHKTRRPVQFEIMEQT